MLIRPFAAFCLDPSPSPAKRWATILALTAVITLVGLPLRDHANHENVMMLYLLGIIWLAGRYGRRMAMGMSVSAFFAYNFFFTEPYYSFAIDSVNDVLSACLLLASGFLAGLHTSALQAKSAFFQRKQTETASLYAMARELATSPERQAMVEIIRRHLAITLPVTAMLWFRNDAGEAELATIDTLHSALPEDAGIAWALEKGEAAGIGTATLPNARGLFLPLRGTGGTFGVLGIIPLATAHRFTAEEVATFEIFSSLAAAALERIHATQAAELRKLEMEGERLRTNLLSSVSHDLRTPLALIKGVIGTLLLGLSDNSRTDLLHAAQRETRRMERMVTNLLDITRLESGIRLNRDFYYLPELLGNAMAQLQPALESHTIESDFPADLPPLWVDGLLVEQLFINLLENSCKHTPENSTIRIGALAEGNMLEITVADNGPGIPEAMRERIFQKFVTLDPRKENRTSGLGLAIARAVAESHGGSLAARAGPEGGACFTCRLPTAQPELAEP